MLKPKQQTKDTPERLSCVWGFNPGQWRVKNVLCGAKGAPVTLPPFPAVIAPLDQVDDLGLDGTATRRAQAIVRGVRYYGGTAAERHPLAIRQMANGRLDAESPIYAALAQIAWAQALISRATPTDLRDRRVQVVTALPAAWLTDGAADAMERHLRTGLDGLITLGRVLVRSEPAAVIYHELLDDTGAYQEANKALATGVVCVGDIGGGTLNRAVVDRLEPIPGQVDSPLLGGRRAIEGLAQRRGVQWVDAEQQLSAAVARPGADSVADGVLRQYREAVVTELQQAWAPFKGGAKAFLFAGGGVYWLAETLTAAFGPRARIVGGGEPHNAIALGLYRYGRRQLARGAS